MKDLDQALNDISAIRAQIARGAEFHGYGPATVAATAGVALLGAAAQEFWLGDPSHHIFTYLAIWVSSAMVAVGLIGAEVVTRSHRIHSGLASAMISSAAEQFMPAAGAAILMTVVLIRFAPEALWMLPGLWQVLFSLGIFAACRSLPRQFCAIAFWYLFTGLACLALARGAGAFSPWAMGLPFGLGQLIAATMLQLTGERGDGEN